MQFEIERPGRAKLVVTLEWKARETLVLHSNGMASQVWSNNL